MHQPARNLETPAHAARESTHESFAETREVHGLEQIAHEARAPRRRNAVELGVNHNVFLGGQFGIGRKGLRNHADGITNAVGILAYVEAGDARGAGGYWSQ